MTTKLGSYTNIYVLGSGVGPVLRVTALLAIVLASLILPPMSLASSDQALSWVELGIAPLSAVAYDYDLDGFQEIVTDVGIVEGYSVIDTPYPPMPYIGKADLDGDGINNLILYGGGKLFIFDSTYKVSAFEVPDVEPVKTRFAYAFGNTIVWGNNTYTIEGVDYVVPAGNQESLFAVYFRDGFLRVLDVLTGNEYTVYKDFKPLYASIHGATIYILSEYDSLLAVIAFSPFTGAKISVYTLPEADPIAFNPASPGFYVKSEGKLYLATLDSLLLVSRWEPIAWDEQYIYVYSGNQLAVVTLLGGVTIASYTLPTTGRPTLALGYPLLFVAYPNGSYVYYDGEPIRVVISAPPVAVVGEEYNFSVSVFPEDVEYRILVDGLPVEVGEPIVFDKYGVHTIEVIASNGITTTYRSATVQVMPRPLDIRIEVLDPPTYEGFMTLKVLTFDGDNKVVVELTITAGGKNYTAVSDQLIAIPVGKVEGKYIPVTISLDSPVYGKVERVFTVPLKPLKPAISTSYLGDGNLEIVLVSPTTGKQVEGNIQVYLATNLLYQGDAPAIVKLPSPGDYELNIIFKPKLPYAFTTANYTISVTYQGETPVDEIDTRTITVADPVETKTITETKPIKVTVSETVTETTTIEKGGLLDNPTALLITLVAMAVALGAGYIIGRNTTTGKQEKHQESAVTVEEL